MAEKKLSEKEIESRTKELKVELLKQGAKRKDIKKEIARLLTMKTRTKSEENKKE